MECSLYLARLQLTCGEAAAAADMLQQLDADIAQHQLTLPDTQVRSLGLNTGTVLYGTLCLIMAGTGK